MGSLFGALLAKHGHDPMLLDHRPERAAQRNRNGITVYEDGKTWHAPVKSSVTTQTCNTFDIVLICTKAYDTASAITSVAPMLSPDAIVVSIQNGLGNAEQILAHAPNRCVCATTAMGACLKTSQSNAIGEPNSSPESVLHWTGHGPTQLAPFAGTPRRHAEQIALLLASIQCDHEVVDDAESMLWSKLIINAAINPVTALFRLPNGALLQHAEAREQAFAAAREACAVADGLGIKRSYEDPTQALTTVCKRTASNRSSMLRDTELGRRTEIEAITGAVIAEAKRLDISVPVNQALYDAIQKQATQHGHKGQP
jgi:2-dehydropantoate 2-reductase